MYDASQVRTRITAEIQLPCGCWVEHGIACIAGPDQFEKTLRLTCDLLPHWLMRAETAHRCELVSEQDPNGESKAN